MSDYLTQRNGYWQFVRRIPLEYAHLDKRASPIKHSTNVPVAKDRHGIKAKKVADQMNSDLTAYWNGLYEGRTREAQDRYGETRRRTRLRFDHAETEELATPPTIKERLEKLEKQVTALLKK